MSGMAPFDEVVEVLGIPLDEEDDFETLNGFLISLIDKIPSDDEVFSTTAYGLSLIHISAISGRARTMTAM